MALPRVRKSPINLNTPVAVSAFGSAFASTHHKGRQLWVGHFDLWTATGSVMLRQALILPDGLIASPAQCELMLEGAIGACERYYPALQFVVWAGKTAQQAMSAAMFDTAGEA